MPLVWYYSAPPVGPFLLALTNNRQILVRKALHAGWSGNAGHEPLPSLKASCYALVLARSGWNSSESAISDVTSDFPSGVANAVLFVYLVER